ncbi:MAG: twin-arginine translocase subunit TatC [Gammaproteobacteria bacterium]|nr:twin-arginine translocase subunit TatC [Gammaproteobacteria bacterium]
MSEAVEQHSEPFVSHLIELRNRMLWAVGSVLILFVLLVPFANDLYEWFAKPLISNLPQGATMISTEPHGPFFIPFKFAFATAFALAIPMVLYQVWAFVAPGLYRNEKRIVLPLVISSTLLFYCGVLFAYYVVFPIIFKFFIGMAPEGVAVMTDISAYMSFALKLFLAFGVAFEVPVATVLLARMGVVSPDNMAKQRPYIILGAFVIGMLMTPPDIFSQIMLAVPVCLLFEIGLFFARKLERNDLRDNQDQ